MSINRSSILSNDPSEPSGVQWLGAGNLSELRPFFAMLLAWLLLFSGSQAVNALEIVGAGNADANTTVMVTDPGDNADANTADGVCDVDLATPGLQCTLRAAIQESNGTAGVDTITFNLTGTGVRTLAPLTILPTISDVVILDGTTQPGFAGTPLIELSGASCATSPCHGLWITAGGSTVKGLIINRFASRGIYLDTGDGNTLTGNIIGADSAGTAAAGNNTGIYVTDSANNTIGGAASDLRNLISGNNIDGINLNGVGTTGNTILGNYIGVDVNGTADLGNQFSGVVILSGASNNTVGGAYAAGRNVISGNGRGIYMEGASGNTVLGNYIGTDTAGAAGIANSTGVWIENGSNNTIGGAAEGSRNILSGNSNGVVIYGSAAAHNQILGNYIGLNSTGTAAIGNFGQGIGINGGAHDNTVGGTTAAARNIISGNGTGGPGPGIYVGSDFSGLTQNNQIIGNYIGTNPAGTAAIANAYGIQVYGALTQIGGTTGVTAGGACTGACNLVSGNSFGIIIHHKNASGTIVEGNYIGTVVSGTTALPNNHGVYVQDTQGVLIGGTTAAARNLISGNTNHGFWFFSRQVGSYSPRVRVQGNYIGLNTAGAALGNGQHGIYLQDAVPITIGGTGADEANVIANNGRDGISAITSAEADISANSIYGNAGLGIDLNDDGVTANDAGDADTGPNGLQNFPVLTSAISGGGTTTIQGVLNSATSSAFRLEFFSDATCDASGNGEGRTYLGAETLTTDGGGNASFTANLATSVVPGQVVVATATDPTGYTSEFSACVVVQAPPAACTPGPHSGTIAADETWCASDSPHTLSGDVVVAPGVTLTIEPGVVVKGNSNVELKVQGHLAAVGTAAQPITFTSTTDTAANQWSGLIFDGGTGDLNYATVRYGGNVNSINNNCSSSGLGFNIAVRNVLAGEVRLQNSQVLSERYLCNGWQNADYGLYVENSYVTVDNTLFQSNGNASDDYPLYAFGANSVVTLTNSVFTANARQRVLFGASVLSTWDATLAPQAGLEGYELGGDMIIPAGRAWTVQPGAVLMGRDDVEIKVQGHLAAIGSPALPIAFTSSTNTGTAQWSGLVFDGGTGDLRHATVRYGGDPNSINGNCSSSGLGFNIAVRNVLAGEVRLENSQVLSERFNCNNWQAEDYGLYVVNSHVVVSDTLFQANGNDGSDYPIYVQSASSTVALTGNTFTGNPRNRVLLAAGALTAINVRLEDEAGLESYELEADYVVPVSITLTVDPGVVIMGRSNVELRTLGHLAAIGTPSQPITFTSSANTAANQWSGLVFDGGTGDLRHVTVRYGGNINSINGSCSTSGLGFNIAARNVLTGEVHLQNSQVLSERYLCNGWQTEDYGLYVDNSHVVVSDTLFQANGNDGNDYPIYVQGANSTLALIGNTFTANPRNRVLVIPGALTAANFTLVAETGLESYELPADFTVPAGITMTLEPGVMVMGRGNVELRTLGHLAAIGAPTQPITFTSATNTAANQWSGLVFDGGTGELQHATVRYGGNVNSINSNCSTSGMGFNVAVRNVVAGEVRLEHSKILSERYTCNNWTASDYGLYVNNSRVAVNNTLFANNGNSSNDYAVYATGASSVLTFDGNVVRNNVRGLQLNGVASQTLRNNAVIDNQQGGVSIGSGTNAQLHHATVARNGGDGVTVASGGSASLVNTILAENVTGLRVNAGGVASLSQTLWDDNGTDTVGAVNQTGSLAGFAVFDDDGYHLTRYSAAIEQGVDAGVLTDVDGEARPQPAGASPDLGADEYIYGYGEEFTFEKIALPLQWAVAPPAQGGLPSGSLIQRYLLRYYYGSPDPNAPALTVSVSDTLPAVLALENEERYPAMSFQQAGQMLSWQTLQPVARGQTGQIEIDTRYENPQPGDVLTNTATLNAGSVSLSDVAVTQVPIFAPLIVAPDNGELCAGQVEIRGLAQPGMTVHLLINNASVLQAQTDASGEFVASYSYAGSATEALTAQACTAGGQCSPVSPSKTLRPPQSFWCPQRSSWEGTPTVGPKAGQHLVFNFRNNTGEFSSQNWRIPGVFGFWNTTLNLHACNCPPASGTTAAPTSVWLIADGVRYDPTGVYPNFTFAVTGAAHNVVFWAQCGANLISSSGRVLIDPDGYVFDVTQGFDPISPTLHAMTGVTVTAYVSLTELGGWAPWPAHLYNNQVNPQVTGADGYFAFFTPPGFYYLQVDGKPGYQPWRSPVVEVVDQIVHVNVPYTPWTETALGEMLPTEVLLTANGPQPADITVAPGSTVLWRAEVDGLATPAQLVQQTDNPALQPLSTLNPISNTLGWDGGMLAPGQTYRRQMDTPGLYTYTDGLGHQGQICVTPCSPMAVSLATFDATAQADHILVAWETASEIDNAGFNLYRSASDDRSSATLVTFVPSQAPGSGQGASYAYQDLDVAAGQTVWYWLEAIDLSGVATLHGPVSVTMQTPTAVKLSHFEAAAPRSGAAAFMVLAVFLLTSVVWLIATDWTFLPRKVQSRSLRS